MKLLLLGRDGQVGWELQRSLACLGEVVGLGRRGGDAIDMCEPAAIVQRIRALRPAAIVNAAAYTAVDRAESEPTLARSINATAPGAIAGASREIGAWLVHFSSDYVFDGSGNTPRDEQATTGPLNVYGQTKLEGEEAIRASGCQHLILRTSWVHSARGGNFARTMLGLAQTRERLQVVDDQVGAPTGADLLADVTAHMLRTALEEPTAGGLFHVAAAGETSWHGYARCVLEWASARGLPLKVAPDGIEAVASSAFPAAATRPLNSRLDTGKLRSRFGLAMPDWRFGVERMLEELNMHGQGERSHG